MTERLAVDEPVTLCEALDRLLHQGVVIHGDVVLSVAGVDLVYLGLDVFLSSVDTAARVGRRAHLPRAHLDH